MKKVIGFGLYGIIIIDENGLSKIKYDSKYHCKENNEIVQQIYTDYLDGVNVADSYYFHNKMKYFKV